MNTRNFNQTSNNLPENLETPLASNLKDCFLESGANLAQFWQEFLKDLPPTNAGDFLNLSSKKKVEVEPGVGRITQEIKLSSTQTSFLKAISEKNSIDLYLLIQAAWAILLSRYSREKDVVFGVTPTSGSFNALPMRIFVDAEENFLSFVKELERLWLILADYRHTHIDEIKEWLNLPKDGNIFEHLLIFNNEIKKSEQVSKYGLVISCFSEAELVIKIQYNREEFKESTIKRVLLHIKTLLENIGLNPNQRLKEISNLCGSEYRQIMMEWNQTECEYPRNLCIHQIIEEQVILQPDAPAVVFGKQQLSYNQLNQKANQLAHYLISLGVGPEVPVVICLERSIELMVAILAVLKAGGGYVPVDPEYPKERINFILEDVKTPVLLTSENLLKELPQIEGRILCLDGLAEEIFTGNIHNPVCEINPENLAYIIYTSGSTGKPKGVLIPHRGVVNHSWYMAKFFELTPADRILQFSTISFDIAVEEIYPTWFRGAALVLRSKEIGTAAEFINFSEQNQISVWNLPTAFWHELVYGLSQTKQALPDALRLVVVGGEKASVKAYENWRTLAGVEKIRWLNSYGPTETTVTATCYEPGSEIPEKLPIGRPIDNTKVYILDENMQPVSIGVAGELYIGGAGVAKGYLNRPETTAERFIPNLFLELPPNVSPLNQNFETKKDLSQNSKKPGNETRLKGNAEGEKNVGNEKPNLKFSSGLLYKTGDLVRYLEDGNIEYLGRLDFQVKIRGYRIELGEIEKAIEQHPAVAQSTVIAQEDNGGEKRIVAYVVGKEKDNFEEKKLREFLQEKLPKYMMPSAFVGMEVLPVTANGKVDRKALPIPKFERSHQDIDFVEPKDDLELQLKLIWEKTLGVKNISLNDNFFDLGGHSLLAVRLLAEIEKTWKKNFPITAFLEAPTIEKQANILRGEGLTVNNSSLVLLNQGGEGVPLFCIYGILLYQPLAHHFDGEREVYGLYLPAEINLLKDGITKEEKRQLTSVPYLASQYRQIIQQKQPTGPYFLAGESFGGLVALEIAQQLRQQGEEVGLVSMFDTFAPDVMKRLPWHTKIGFHLQNIQRERGQYLFSRLKQRVEVAKNQFLSYWAKFAHKLEKRTPEILATPLTETPMWRVRDHMIDQAMQNYEPQPYAGKVVLFRAMDCSQFEWYYTEPKLWSKIAVGELQVYEVSGDHLGILKEPHVSVLAELLKKSL